MKKNIFFSIAITLLVFTNAAIAQNNWTQKTPSNHPSFTSAHAMAWVGDDKIVLFGGLKTDFVFSDETWVYDISDDSWTLKNPVNHPSARCYHAMASAGGDQVVLFGGLASDGFSYLGDTWVYDLSDNNWTLKSTATSPNPQSQHVMANLSGDKVFLYPDLGNTTVYIYDLSDNNWTAISTSNFPISILGGHAAANIGSGKVLWSGMAYNDQTFVQETQTWAYDQATNNWTKKNPAAALPKVLFHSMSSLGGDRVLFFGGFEFDFGGGPYGTWIYDLSDDAWTNITSGPAPSERNSLAMASVGNKTVLFGGITNTMGDETWLFTGDATCNMEVSAGIDENLYFGYAADQCVTKTVTVTNGTGPFTYNWTLNRSLLPGESMTGNTTASVTVCLLDTTELCVTVTGGGCSVNDCATIFAEDVRCSSGNSSNQKVKVCHNGNTICVESNAVNAHIAHGDYIGKCTGAVSAESEIDIEENLKSGFTVYPNPSSGNITVTINLNSDEHERSIRVINVSGQVVKQINIADQSKVDLKMDKAGIYLVQLITGKNIITKKVLVIH